MEQINFVELAKQLSDLTKLDCVATENSILVHPNSHDCIWTPQLSDIILFCKVHNLIYFIDFVSKYFRISTL